MPPAGNHLPAGKPDDFLDRYLTLHTMRELETLDDQVNTFLKENGIHSVASVSDTCTTDDSGATIGIIRVVAYQD